MRLTTGCWVLNPTSNPVQGCAIFDGLVRCGTYPRIRAAIKQVASGKKAAPAAAKQDRS